MGVAQTRKGRVADAHGKKTRADRTETGGLAVRRSRRARLPHGKKTRAPTARKPAARPFVAPARQGCRTEGKPAPIARKPAA